MVAGFDGALRAVGSLLRMAADGSGRTATLFGHSMGGAISLRLALERPEAVRALALSSPFLLDAVARPAAQVAAARILARLLPQLPVARPDETRISRDAAEVARYRSDPLIHHAGVPAVTGLTLISEGAALLARASSLGVPALVVHGTDDGYASVEGSRRLAAASERVELVEVEGGYHELHHDSPEAGVPEYVRGRFLEWFSR